MQGSAVGRDQPSATFLSAYAGAGIWRLGGRQGARYPASAQRRRRFRVLLAGHAVGASGKLRGVGDPVESIVFPCVGTIRYRGRLQGETNVEVVSPASIIRKRSRMSLRSDPTEMPPKNSG